MSVHFVSIDKIHYSQLRVTRSNREDAVKVSTELDGQLFHDMHIRVSHTDIPLSTITLGVEEEKEDDVTE